MSTSLAESLHTLIDAEAARLHQVIDELLARHAEPAAPSHAARICIDAGHGGGDPGAVVGNVQEKDVILEYALELGRQLGARGHRIRLTRGDDTFLQLSDRARISNEMAADCFLSIHANFASSEVADGAWIIHAEGSRLGRGLAKAIFSELATVPGILDKDPETEVYADATPWVGGRRLTVLRKTYAPAVLVELGFLSNADDLTQLLDPDERWRICKAIANGIEAWSKGRSIH